MISLLPIKCFFREKVQKNFSGNSRKIGPKIDLKKGPETFPKKPMVQWSNGPMVRSIFYPMPPARDANLSSIKFRLALVTSYCDDKTSKDHKYLTDIFFYFCMAASYIFGVDSAAASEFFREVDIAYNYKLLGKRSQSYHSCKKLKFHI